MVKRLTWFWLRRFTQVFIAVFFCLTTVEFVPQGITSTRWSIAAALIAATIVTYWAYRIQCKVVYGDKVGNNNQNQD